MMRKFTTIILLFCIFLLMTGRIQAQNADIEMLRHINSSLPGLRPVSVFITETANPLNLAVPAILGGYALFTGENDLLKDAIGIAMASGINWGMTLSLKAAFRRERPAITYPGELNIYEIRTDYSMPSGHTSGAFSTATSLSLRYPEWYVIVPAYAWAASVGYSRMHLGLHYPSDVLAGALLGAGSAYLTYKFNNWLWDNYDIKGLRIIRK